MSRSQLVFRILAAKDAFYRQFELVGGNIRHCTYLNRLCSVCQSLTCSAEIPLVHMPIQQFSLKKEIQQYLKKLEACMGWIESIYILIARQLPPVIKIIVLHLLY